MFAGLVVLMALLLPLLAWNGLVEQGNATTQDLLMRLRPAPGTDRIVLLAIDGKTASEFGPLPLQRHLLAAGLERLAAAKPQVVVLDMLLAEASDPPADKRLAQALPQLSGVILGAALEDQSDPNPDPDVRPAWIYPLPEFRGLNTRVGHVHVSPDPDGLVRNISLLKANDNGKFWALTLETLAFIEGGTKLLPQEYTGRLVLGSRSIPGRSEQGYLLWIHYAVPHTSFPTASFSQLLDGSARPEDFTGKIVILGVTAQGAGDRQFTPVSQGLGMPGIEIHANILRTLLDQDFLYGLEPTTEYLVLLAGSAVVFGLAWWGQERGLAGAMAAGLVLLPLTAYWAFGRGLLLPLASLLAGHLAACLLAMLGLIAAARWQLDRAEAGRRDAAFRLQAIAHEIKTPLTAIQASSELMSESALAPEKKAAVAQLIHKESKRLAGVVNTFLEVERISAGVLQLQRRPVDLAQVAGEAVERAQLLAIKKSITIESHLSPVEISGDGELLAFAVYNLLTNAIKYSPAGSAITVTLEAGQERVCLAVADQGLGIEPAEQARIFERFYRLERDTRSGQPGTGLGLALVKEIAVQHGGSVEVKSAPGRGSRFTLLLPREVHT